MNSDAVEIWKDIKGFEGMYQVSNLGRVKSLPRRVPGLHANRELIRKPTHDKDGYLFVGLHKFGKTYNKRISRLVAEAFIRNPNNYPEVNHKDENKQNNNVDNLEWCTTRYNLTYGHRLDCAKGERSHLHKLTTKQIDEIRRVCIKGDPEYGYSALGRKFGVSHTAIEWIVKRKSWKHIKED